MVHPGPAETPEEMLVFLAELAKRRRLLNPGSPIPLFESTDTDWGLDLDEDQEEEAASVLADRSWALDFEADS